jgi:hypothetical protein
MASRRSSRPIVLETSNRRRCLPYFPAFFARFAARFSSRVFEGFFFDFFS